MAKLLRDYGQIHNESRCLDEFRRRLPELRALQNDSLIKVINQSVDKATRQWDVRYFTSNYDELSQYESGRAAMWLHSGYSNRNGEPIYVQFTGGVPWQGALVGTEDEILSYQEACKSGRIQKTLDRLQSELNVDLSKLQGISLSSDERDTETSVIENMQKSSETQSKTEAFAMALHEKLLIPNSWTVEYLENYIYLLVSRLNNMLSKGISVEPYVSYNSDSSLALINSGLLDSFGKYIMLLLKAHRRENNVPVEFKHNEISIAGGKASLVGCGFSKEVLNSIPERVSFYSDASELLFKGSIDDFDLDNSERLTHCILDRRDRFPEEYQGLTEESVYSDMVRAIELAIELNKYDRNYIKPIYGVKRDMIQFVIPYHIRCNFQKKPELGLLVSYIDGFWQVMTVLDYDNVLKDVKLFTMYENESF